MNANSDCSICLPVFQVNEEKMQKIDKKLAVLKEKAIKEKKLYDEEKDKVQNMETKQKELQNQLTENIDKRKKSQYNAQKIKQQLQLTNNKIEQLKDAQITYKRKRKTNNEECKKLHKKENEMLMERKLKLDFACEVNNKYEYLMEELKYKRVNQSIIKNLQMLHKQYLKHFVVPFVFAESSPDFVPNHPCCFPSRGHFTGDCQLDKCNYVLPSTNFDFWWYQKTMLYELGILYEFVKFHNDEEYVLYVVPCYMCSFFNYEHNPVYVFHFKSNHKDSDRYFETVYLDEGDDMIEKIWKLNVIWHEDAKSDDFNYYISWIPDHVLEEVFEIIRPNAWCQDSALYKKSD